VDRFRADLLDGCALTGFVPDRGFDVHQGEADIEDELSLAELKRVRIQRVSAKTDRSKANAAKILRLERRTLYRTVAEFEGGLFRPTNEG